jgi:D-alanyl-D-alanine dipeptidase
MENFNSEPNHQETQPDHQLVSIQDAGLLGSSFYWHRHEDYGVAKEELVETGMTDDQVFVSPEIIPALIAVDSELQQKGWRLYLREGYRSEALYKLLYQKRVEKFGQEMTDKLLNIEDMPHATGKAVDVSLWDDQTDSEIRLRKAGDGPESLLRGHYQYSEDPETQECYERQEYMIYLMWKHGFRLGKKNEFFHFNHEPLAQARSLQEKLVYAGFAETPERATLRAKVLEGLARGENVQSLSDDYQALMESEIDTLPTVRAQERGIIARAVSMASIYLEVGDLDSCLEELDWALRYADKGDLRFKIIQLYEFIDELELLQNHA